MFQPDFFMMDQAAEQTVLPADIGGLSEPAPTRYDAANDTELDLPAVLERLADISTRPRYTFMVLNLIARAAGQSDSAGPYVREDGRAVAIRDWLSDALMPMAQRDARRVAVVQEVRSDLARKGLLPEDSGLARERIAEEVRARLRHSGRTNVSRAVSDLVRAGLIRRHYQGYRVDHENRGAQREAVYTLAPLVRRALGR
ncbi:Stk19 family serine/threonine-protein kinase [Sphingomonas morindae]|uniref:Uncharacterized protein n=1 Tax=Sphingomonas morindae TaxID=1541170 RepID=A0ABY4XDN8_9SPHN|nr:Stk19 family serine/threonine-protein kinase [Sphingomonas morindae]USI75099.1 hypothetical protein LHA26_19595 [Sphingomonas morindae]